MLENLLPMIINVYAYYLILSNSQKSLVFNTFTTNVLLDWVYDTIKNMLIP